MRGLLKVFIINLGGFFNPKLVLYEFPLVVLHTQSIISFHMLGGRFFNLSAKFGFIKGQPHFNASWHVRLGLTPK